MYSIWEVIVECMMEFMTVRVEYLVVKKYAYVYSTYEYVSLGQFIGSTM